MCFSESKQSSERYVQLKIAVSPRSASRDHDDRQKERERIKKIQPFKSASRLFVELCVVLLPHSLGMVSFFWMHISLWHFVRGD